MKHEIIIKNGVAGVEINNRFYTHYTLYLFKIPARILDVDGQHVEPRERGGYYIYVAAPEYGQECIRKVTKEDIFQIPVPDWVIGSKVLVRDDDSDLWSERYFAGIVGDSVATTIEISGRKIHATWKQCKLAEGV